MKNTPTYDFSLAGEKRETGDVAKVVVVRGDVSPIPPLIRFARAVELARSGVTDVKLLQKVAEGAA